MASQATLSLLVELKDQASKGLGSIGNSLRTVGTIAGGIALGGVAAFGAALVSGIGDAREAAVIMAQTEQTIKTMGNAAGVSAQHVADFASSLSDAAGMSLFGDNQVQAATNMLLTFSNIKGATLDLATTLSVDMAQALKSTPEAMSKLVGKTLNSADAMSALRKQGVSFTDEQIKLGKHLFETGHIAEYQALVMNELNAEFGGQAAAAAKAAGGMVQFKARLGEAAETMGRALLPALDMLGSFLNTTIAPALEAGAVAFGEMISAFQTGASDGAGIIGGLSNALYYLGGVSPIFDTLGDAFNRLVDDISTIGESWRVAGDFTSSFFEQLGGTIDLLVGTEGVFQDVGIAITNAFGGLAATFTDARTPIEGVMNVLSQISPSFALLRGMVEAALPQIQAFAGVFAGDILNGITTVWVFIQTSLMPILNDLSTAVMPLLSAAVQILAGLWTDVLVPAIQVVWGVLTTVTPLLADLAHWLAEVLPPAIQGVADFLTGTLFPAIHTVFDFIGANLIPILATVVQWLRENVPAAIQELAQFWTGTLQPALAAVWAFIQTNVIPILNTLVTVYIAVLKVELQALSALWTNVLLPALNAVWSFLNTYVIPLIAALANVSIAILKKEVELLAALWSNVLLPALTDVWNFIQTNVIPVIDATGTQAGVLAGTIRETLGPAFTWLGDNVLKPVKGFFNDIGGAVSDVIHWLNDLASRINSIQIPDWLRGHSPPPMADWFSYIADALGDATGQSSAFADMVQGPLASAVESMSSALTDGTLVAQAAALGTDMMGQLSGTIESGASGVLGTIASVGERIRSALEEMTRGTGGAATGGGGSSGGGGLGGVFTPAFGRGLRGMQAAAAAASGGFGATGGIGTLAATAAPDTRRPPQSIWEAIAGTPQQPVQTVAFGAGAIVIHAAPGTNERQIAEMVVREIDRKMRSKK